MKKVFKFFLLFIFASGVLFWLSPLSDEIKLKLRVSLYLSSIPNIKIKSLRSFSTNTHPQVYGEVEVIGKGNIVFNSIWPQDSNKGTNKYGELNSSISKIGNCSLGVSMGVVDGGRDWVSLFEIEKPKIDSLKDVFVSYEEILKTVKDKTWISKDGYYSNCSL